MNKEERCQNCHFWSRIRTTDKGHCDSEAAYTAASIIQTDEDFGCVMFQEKVVKP